MRKEHYLVGGALLGGTLGALWQRKKCMASRDLIDRLRKAQEANKKLAAKIVELQQSDQEAANLADEIFNTSTSALQDSGGGGSTGGGSGAQTPPPQGVGPGQQGQQNIGAQQAAQAVQQANRPGAQQGR